MSSATDEGGADGEYANTGTDDGGADGEYENMDKIGTRTSDGTSWDLETAFGLSDKTGGDAPIRPNASDAAITGQSSDEDRQRLHAEWNQSGPRPQSAGSAASVSSGSHTESQSSHYVNLGSSAGDGTPTSPRPAEHCPDLASPVTAATTAGGPDSTAPLSAAERAKRKREQDRAAAKLRREARTSEEEPTTAAAAQQNDPAVAAAADAEPPDETYGVMDHANAAAIQPPGNDAEPPDETYGVMDHANAAAASAGLNGTAIGADSTAVLLGEPALPAEGEPRPLPPNANTSRRASLVSVDSFGEPPLLPVKRVSVSGGTNAAALAASGADGAYSTMPSAVAASGADGAYSTMPSAVASIVPEDAYGTVPSIHDSSMHDSSMHDSSMHDSSMHDPSAVAPIVPEDAYGTMASATMPHGSAAVAVPGATPDLPVDAMTAPAAEGEGAADWNSAFEANVYVRDRRTSALKSKSVRRSNPLFSDCDDDDDDAAAAAAAAGIPAAAMVPENEEDGEPASEYMNARLKKHGASESAESAESVDLAAEASLILRHQSAENSSSTDHPDEGLTYMQMGLAHGSTGDAGGVPSGRQLDGGAVHEYVNVDDSVAHEYVNVDVGADAEVYSSMDHEAGQDDSPNSYGSNSAIHVHKKAAIMAQNADRASISAKGDPAATDVDADYETVGPRTTHNAPEAPPRTTHTPLAQFDSAQSLTDFDPHQDAEYAEIDETPLPPAAAAAAAAAVASKAVRNKLLGECAVLGFDAKTAERVLLNAKDAGLGSYLFYRPGGTSVYATGNIMLAMMPTRSSVHHVDIFEGVRNGDSVLWLDGNSKRKFTDLESLSQYYRRERGPLKYRLTAIVDPATVDPKLAPPVLSEA